MSIVKFWVVLKRKSVKIENIDKKYEDISSNLKNIYYELQEISRDISEHKEDVYFDEQERNEVEERLDLIYNLKRKYGNDVQEILNYKDEIEAEINHIENLDEYNNKLKKELKQLSHPSKEKVVKVTTITLFSSIILAGLISLDTALVQKICGLIL